MGVGVLVSVGVSVICVGVAVMVAEGVMDGVKLGAGLGKVKGVWVGAVVAEERIGVGVGTKVGMIRAEAESSFCWQPANDSHIIAKNRMILLSVPDLIVTEVLYACQ